MAPIARGDSGISGGRRWAGASRVCEAWDAEVCEVQNVARKIRGFYRLAWEPLIKTNSCGGSFFFENGPRSPRIQVASCLVFMCLVLFIFSWLQTTVKWKWVQQLLFGQYEGDADVEKAVGRLVDISKTARDGVYFTLVAFFACVLVLFMFGWQQKHVRWVWVKIKNHQGSILGTFL